jgi:branched-subunit amino acid ABC-type transport system permease component
VQIAIGLPVAYGLLRRQWRRPQLPEAIAGFALLLFISQFFSRIFNDNYLGLIIALMAVAALMDVETTRVPTTIGQTHHS